MLASVISGSELPLSVQITPGFIGDVDLTCPLTSQPATANVSGGRGPFNYLWSAVSGGSGITINSPTSQTTTFTVNSSGAKSGTYRCTVTDADLTVKFDEINVTLECGIA